MGARRRDAQTTTVRDEASTRVLRFHVGERRIVAFVRPAFDGAILASLAEAEREVAALVIEGKSNKEIAALRGVATRTVANQVAAIFRRLRVHSRTELIARLYDAPTNES